MLARLCSLQKLLLLFHSPKLVTFIPDSNHCLKHLHQLIKIMIKLIKLSAVCVCTLQNQFENKNVFKLILFQLLGLR